MALNFLRLAAFFIKSNTFVFILILVFFKKKLLGIVTGLTQYYITKLIRGGDA